MALPQELHARCRTTLLKCSEFDNYNSLRAIFVTTELSIYQHGLPQCETKEDLVSQTIAYLLPRRLTDKRPVLPLFLAELRERYYYGDALYDELDELCTDVAQVLSDKIIIPFVVAAMTQAEATDLMAETVFNDPNVAPAERARFQQFEQALKEHGINDLLSCYGEERASWKPLACSHTSISKIISDMLDHINDHCQESQDSPRLLPYFLSEDFFAEDRITRRQALEQLRQSGGVLVIDAISIFHPILNQSILRSDISSNKRVAILVVSPIDTSVLSVNQLIEQAIEMQMETAFTRFDYDFDRLCEIGVSDLRGIKRWLFATLRQTAINIQKQRPNLARIKLVEQRRGEKPSGYGPADFMSLGGV